MKRLAYKVYYLEDGSKIYQLGKVCVVIAEEEGDTGYESPHKVFVLNKPESLQYWDESHLALKAAWKWLLKENGFIPLNMTDNTQWYTSDMKEYIGETLFDALDTVSESLEEK
jgi:hypothetical protein